MATFTFAGSSKEIEALVEVINKDLRYRRDFIEVTSRLFPVLREKLSVF